MNNNRVPQLLVERLAKGELPEPKKTEVERRLAREPGGAERLSDIERSDRAILTELPPARFRATLETRTGARPGRSWTWGLVPAVGLAAAALVLLPQNDDAPLGGAPGVVDSERRGSEGAVGVEETRNKGPGSDLVVFRGQERLVDGAAAAEGDLLQLGYVAREPGFAVLLARDGWGVVTVLEPARSDQALPLEPSGTLQTFSSSYELDSAPDYERFFWVRSRERFSVAPVRRAVARWSEGEPLDLPEDFEQATFMVQK
ncbi:MAG: ActD-like protein [Myxococcota bacterium]